MTTMIWLCTQVWLKLIKHVYSNLLTSHIIKFDKELKANITLPMLIVWHNKKTKDIVCENSTLNIKLYDVKHLGWHMLR